MENSYYRFAIVKVGNESYEPDEQSTQDSEHQTEKFAKPTWLHSVMAVLSPLHNTCRSNKNVTSIRLCRSVLERMRRIYVLDNQHRFFVNGSLRILICFWKSKRFFKKAWIFEWCHMTRADGLPWLSCPSRWDFYENWLNFVCFWANLISSTRFEHNSGVKTHLTWYFRLCR